MMTVTIAAGGSVFPLLDRLPVNAGFITGDQVSFGYAFLRSKQLIPSVALTAGIGLIDF